MLTARQAEKKRAAKKKAAKRNAPTQQRLHFSNFELLRKIQDSLSPAQIEFIRQNVAPTLNDIEIVRFVYRAKITDLDPLAGDLLPHIRISTDKKTGKRERRLVIITARDAKRKIAVRTGKLGAIVVDAIYQKAVPVADSDERVLIRVEPWEGGELWGASARVYRKDFEQPTIVTVTLKEYKQDNRMWRGKPETMIKKVAESQALSAAFPELLSGTYDEAERFDEEPTTPEIPEDNRPATDAQKAILKGLGVKMYEAKKDVTFSDAARMISEATQKK